MSGLIALWLGGAFVSTANQIGGCIKHGQPIGLFDVLIGFAWPVTTLEFLIEVYRGDDD